MTVLIYGPDDINEAGGFPFVAADMKAAPGIQYSTGVLPAQDSFIFNPVFSIVNVGGGAAGLAKLIIESLDDQDNVIKTLDAVTAIPTNTADATVQCDLIFGAGVAPAIYGVGTIDPLVPKFKIMFKYRLIIEIVDANNGTSSVLTLSLVQEG